MYHYSDSIYIKVMISNWFNNYFYIIVIESDICNAIRISKDIFSGKHSTLEEWS